VNLDPLRSLLTEHLGAAFVAFIYGSVAADRAGPSSDIDCFVITAGEIGAPQRRQLVAEFAELQRALGFTPDLDYPIEIFSAEACHAILQSTALNHMLTAAMAANLDRGAADSDDMEVLRALLDRRLVLRHAPVLDRLTTQARVVIRRCPAEPMALLRVLGLVDPQQVWQ
jgi:predicted nucleotidyltransferase